MGMRTRGAALLAAGCVLASGCAAGGEPAAEEPTEPLIRRTYDDDEDAPPDEASGAADGEASDGELAPWPEPLATPVAADDGPELEEVTGRDWEQVVQGLLDLEFEAYERRDLAIGRLFATEQCACFENLTTNIETLAEYDVRRVHEDRPTVRVLDVVAEERGIVTLELVLDEPAATAVSSDGHVLERREASTIAARWTLVDEGDKEEAAGPWRLAIAEPREADEVSL